MPRNASTIFTLLTAIALTLPLPPALAKESGCNFFNRLKHGEYEFEISSRPVPSNNIHIINVKVIKGGRQLTQVSGDVDGTTLSATLTDMDADSVPELLITARLPGGNKAAAAALFALQGDQLRRIWLPKLAEEHLAGYKGRDSYRLEAGTLLRSFPVFTARDRKCCPTGGTKTFRYVLRDGALETELVEDARLERAAAPSANPHPAPRTTNSNNVPSDRPQGAS